MAGARSPATRERTAAFVERLNQHQSDEELRKIQRYFRSGQGEYGEGDVFIGVRMGDIFALAKEHIDLPPGEIETLLQSPVHEVRAGALSVMDKQARRKRTAEARRRDLYDLYLRRIDRIDNWDLVDVIRNPDEQWVHGGHGADNRIDQIRVGQASFTVDPGPPVRNPVPSRCTRIPYDAHRMCW